MPLSKLLQIVGRDAEALTGHEDLPEMRKLHRILASCLPHSEVLLLESRLGSRTNSRVLGSAVVIWSTSSC